MGNEGNLLVLISNVPNSVNNYIFFFFLFLSSFCKWVFCFSLSKQYKSIFPLAERRKNGIWANRTSLLRTHLNEGLGVLQIKEKRWKQMLLFYMRPKTGMFQRHCGEPIALYPSVSVSTHSWAGRAWEQLWLLYWYDPKKKNLKSYWC